MRHVFLSSVAVFYVSFLFLVLFARGNDSDKANEYNQAVLRIEYNWRCNSSRYY